MHHSLKQAHQPHMLLPRALSVLCCASPLLLSFWSMIGVRRPPARWLHSPWLSLGPPERCTRWRFSLTLASRLLPTVSNSNSAAHSNSARHSNSVHPSLRNHDNAATCRKPHGRRQLRSLQQCGHLARSCTASGLASKPAAACGPASTAIPLNRVASIQAVAQLAPTNFHDHVDQRRECSLQCCSRASGVATEVELGESCASCCCCLARDQHDNFIFLPATFLEPMPHNVNRKGRCFYLPAILIYRPSFKKILTQLQGMRQPGLYPAANSDH